MNCFKYKDYFSFYIIDTLPEKNGDQVYFGIVQAYNYKTFCYFSRNQINVVRQDFKLEELTVDIDDLFASKSGFHYNKKTALSDKFFFNLAIIYFHDYSKNEPKEWEMKYIKQKIQTFKKYPLMNLILDDKQVVFYGKKGGMDYKQSFSLHMPQFNVAWTQNLGKMKSLTEVALHLIPNANQKELKILKRYLINSFVHSPYSSKVVNFEKLAMIQFMAENLGSKTTVRIIEQDKFDQLMNRLKYVSNALLTESKTKINFREMIKILVSIDPEWAEKMILKWDVPFVSGIINEFSNYYNAVTKAGIKIQYTRYSSLNYVASLLSKEFVKIKGLNFILPNKVNPGLEIPKNFKLEGYACVVATQFMDLVRWGATLHNCAGNFEQQDYYKRVISIGVLKDEKIEFLISIDDGEMTQFKGFKNSAPGKDFYNKMTEKLMNQKFINESIEYEACCFQPEEDEIWE